MLDLIHRLPPGYKRFSTCLRSKDSHTRKSELCSESQKVLPDQICQGTLYFTTNDKKFILTMDRRDRFEELFREPDSEQWKTLAGFFLYDLPGFPPDPYAGRQLS